MPFFQALFFLAAVGSTNAWASPPLEEHPGYVDFASLGLFDEADPEATLEIFLKDPLLDLVAAASRVEDKELADMLDALHLIRVLVHEDLGASYQSIAGRLKDFTLPDWEQVVQVRDRNERMQFYVRTADEGIVGLLLLVCEPGEFVFINIVGPLDLAQVGRIGRKFDIAPLDSIDLGGASSKAMRQE